MAKMVEFNRTVKGLGRFEGIDIGEFFVFQGSEDVLLLKIGTDSTIEMKTRIIVHGVNTSRTVFQVEGTFNWRVLS